MMKAITQTKYKISHLGILSAGIFPTTLACSCFFFSFKIYSWLGDCKVAQLWERQGQANGKKRLYSSGCSVSARSPDVWCVADGQQLVNRIAISIVRPHWQLWQLKKLISSLLPIPGTCTKHLGFGLLPTRRWKREWMTYEANNSHQFRNFQGQEGAFP